MKTVALGYDVLQSVIDEERPKPSDLQSICNAVLELKDVFEDNENRSDRSCMGSLATLLVEIIAANGLSMEQTGFSNAQRAGRILIKYILQRIANIDKDEETKASTLKSFIAPITSFCAGTACLTKEECKSLLSTIQKNASELSFPFVGADGAISVTECDSTGGKPTSGVSADAPIDNRPQTDLTCRMMSHFSTPLQSISTQERNFLGNENDETQRTPQASFISNNMAIIQSLHAGDYLLNACLSLNELSKYITLWEAVSSDGSFQLVTTLSEALEHCQTFSKLAEEIDVAWRALTLPVLEPLSTGKLQKITKIIMGCLVASVSVSASQSIISQAPSGSTPSLQDDYDSLGVEIVEKSLELFNTIQKLMIKSTRAGGHISQNMAMMGASIILTGLHIQMAPGKKYNQEGVSKAKLWKAIQGFGVLSVALGSQALALTSYLLDDLTTELDADDFSGDEAEADDNDVPAPFLNVSSCDIFTPLTARQRAGYILDAAPLVHHLLNIAAVSLEKSSCLRCASPSIIQKSSVASQNDQHSGATDSCNAEDDLTGSEMDDGDDDSDSEPILGKWFAETLFPPEGDAIAKETSDSREETANRKRGTGDQGVVLLVPQRGEASGFVRLTAKIFHLLNQYFTNCRTKYLSSYFRDGVDSEQMCILAGMIDRLDVDTLNKDTVVSVENEPTALNLAYADLSASLALFNHNIIVHKLLSNRLQDSLLCLLNISPTEEFLYWPLLALPRSLSLLAHILLVRQNTTEQSGAYAKSNAYAFIWGRLLKTLATQIVRPESESSGDFDDLNVEHAQLMIFFFHALSLLQKKQILLSAANYIIKTLKVVQSEGKTFASLKQSRIMHFSRLVLLFEYIMKHLYEPPQSLLDQVENNIFKKFLRPTTSESPASVDYHSFHDKDYKESQPIPKFYNLFVAPSSAFSSSSEAPKLDGLALSFILSSGDTLNYNSLYQSLIDALQVVHQTFEKTNPSASQELLTSKQYCFSIIWRVLQSLPPSLEYIDNWVQHQKLEDPCEETDYEVHAKLHELSFSTRFYQKVYVNWVKDALVKQGRKTSAAEAQLKTLTSYVTSFDYDLKNYEVVLRNFFGKLHNKLVAIEDPDELPEFFNSLAIDAYPSFSDYLLIDTILTKVMISLPSDLPWSTSKGGSQKPQVESADSSSDETASTSGSQSQDLSGPLLALTLKLTEALLVCTKSLVLSSVNEDELNLNESTKRVFVKLIRVAGVMTSKEAPGGSFDVRFAFPLALKTSLQKWRMTCIPEKSNAWRNQSVQDHAQIGSVIQSHLNCLNESPAKTNAISLKQCLDNTIRLIMDMHELWRTNETMLFLNRLLGNCCCEFKASEICQALDKKKTLGEEPVKKKLQEIFIVFFEELNIDNTVQKKYFTDKLKCEMIKYMTDALSQKIGLNVLDEIIYSNEDFSIGQLFRLATVPDATAELGNVTLKFLLKIAMLGRENQGSSPLLRLCCDLSSISDSKPADLEEMFKHIVLGRQPPDEDEIPYLVDNRQLLLQFAHCAVDNQHFPHDLSLAILEAFIPYATTLLSPTSEGMPFTELLAVMSTFAGVRSGYGHVKLLRGASVWLSTCRTYLTQRKVLEKLEDGVSTGKHAIMIENTWQILKYIGEIVMALKLSIEPTSRPALIDVDSCVDTDGDWLDELNEDEDSATEDSDDDSLNNKLCTFTQTHKEFMNQHWYHCHTCKMVDGVGVCTVCAPVCHAGHDVTYSKHGSFFCDCGAKEDGSCIALTKRTSAVVNERRAAAQTLGNNVSSAYDSSLAGRRRGSLAINVVNEQKPEREAPKATKDDIATKKRIKLANLLSDLRHYLVAEIVDSQMVPKLVDILEELLPAIQNQGEKVSSLGRLSRLQDSLNLLHEMPKSTKYTDWLVVPTLGSQEGAFENVRMTYGGDQGQAIRQLLTSHMIRRVVMSCMTAGGSGKRQHLAVAHEKGKVTILQLTALLKQTDSTQKKLSLTRLSSQPVPFTVLSIVANPCNEDFLAVTGLKECHVLAFNNNGTLADHLSLYPQLDAHNYILKAVWMPGSQTELSLVTSDFVKIFDLGKDPLSPQYYFLVPSGKIRDCTLAFTEEGKFVIIMSSGGHIYFQALNDDSLAVHGPFYVTNIMSVNEPCVNDDSDQIGGGGVSVYFSHSLQCLFFSYVNGRNFMSPMKTIVEEIQTIFPISVASRTASNLSTFGGQPSSSAGSSPSGKAAASQPLCQWSEVSGHPGLVTAFLQSSNNPVIMLIKPEEILLQEIKLTSKSKIVDMVGIRHSATNQTARTTFILLCEDGSLKVFMANSDGTNFWIAPVNHPLASIMQAKPPRKKRQRMTKSNGNVTFPVDFFEHCSVINDVEFGGPDVLQIYNVNQIRNRLQTSSLYIANTKTAGFQLEVTNNDFNQVMVGVRILIGSQDTDKVPTYIEIFGRVLNVNLTRARWYDFPFTREESCQADKKLTIKFGPSHDIGNVNLVDSVLIYGKSKESFGLQEDHDESLPGTNSSANGSGSNEGNSSQTKEEAPIVPNQPMQDNLLDRLVTSLLEAVDGCFGTNAVADSESLRQSVLTLCSKLLTIPTSNSVDQSNKSLMAQLFPVKTTFYNYKDNAMLRQVLRSIQEHDDADKEMDVETFQRLILTARNVAVTHPSNLVRFAECGPFYSDSENPTTTSDKTKTEERRKFILRLINCFWQLLANCPLNTNVSAIGKTGLTHIEATVQALVEIFHAFSFQEIETLPMVAQIYSQLLMAENTQVSFAAKQALVRVLRPRIRRRRVFVPSPQDSTSPELVQRPQPPVQPPNAEEQFQNEARAEDNDLHVGPGGIPLGGIAGNFDVLLPEVLGRGAGQVIDLTSDIDDETMVELAIALSLQDQGDAGGELENIRQGIQRLEGLQQGLHQLAHLGPDFPGFLPGMLGGSVGGLVANPPEENPAQQEPSHYSDTTASAPASDDEGGNGVLIRSPQPDQEGAGSLPASESGGSEVQSIAGDASILGRRSSFEAVEAPIDNMEVTESNDFDSSSQVQLNLRHLMLDQLIGYMSQLHGVGGLRCIPFMQVILMLTTDLDETDERDKARIDKLLISLIDRLPLESEPTNVVERTPDREMQLVILRHVSILMSRSKSWQGDGGSLKSIPPKDTNFTAKATASALIQSGVTRYCLSLLKNLLSHWKSKESEETSVKLGGTLLKAHPLQSPPDMSPFFLKQYVKSHAHDIFEAYPQQLTEMALRIPYLCKKANEDTKSAASAELDKDWQYILCEYMMTHQTPYARRQVRKLLMLICGTKEKYRELRDIQSLESHFLEIKTIIGNDDVSSEKPKRLNGLSYDTLLKLIEHLKTVADIANLRNTNWQKFCHDNPNVLTYLLHASVHLDDGVTSIILQLLQTALMPPQGLKMVKSQSPTKTARREKPKTYETEVTDVDYTQEFASYLAQHVDDGLLTKFSQRFLLESNSTSVRWQAHNLFVSILKRAENGFVVKVMDIFWKLWPKLPCYGKKAAQFVDLLGYFSTKANFSDELIGGFVADAVNALRVLNMVLSNHPNAGIYGRLTHLVDFNGYFLESDPCLVCNNPEVPFTSHKLATLKAETKFTTSTQIVKLSGSQSISKISLRIGDLKRQKMVRTINIFYNNKSVQAVVELKSNQTVWHKAKRVSLTAGQTDIKIEFPLPIVACNLKIEYADYYENIQASTETLQCPRCSASVPANPGVCSNCGENVYQCHKCRSINYDEKDPFLCNACGFCKYAKFEYSLAVRPCCTVDPIENEEDRSKAIANVNSLLEKADIEYKKLVSHKPALEELLSKISTSTADAIGDETTVPVTGSVGVNAHLVELAQKYCGECKNSFEDLSKIIQRVMATRKELVAFDESRKIRLIDRPVSNEHDVYQNDGVVLTKCYGCASASVEHCLTILRALASKSSLRVELFQQGLIEELMEFNLHRGTNNVKVEVRKLISLITRDNILATEHLNDLILNKIVLAIGTRGNADLVESAKEELALLAVTLQRSDECWEERLKCLMQIFFMSTKNGRPTPIVIESITLPCLTILNLLVSGSETDENVDLMSVREPYVDVNLWHSGYPNHSFESWEKSYSRRFAEKTQIATGVSDTDKLPVREIFLMSKYFDKWIVNMWRKKQRNHQTSSSQTEVIIASPLWLKSVIFNKSSRTVRRVACGMLDIFGRCSWNRSKKMVDLLASFLGELGSASEASTEFVDLFNKIISHGQWKYYLAFKGVLQKISNLITIEIDKLNRLEMVTLNADLAQGFALKTLTDLLSSFVDVEPIKMTYKTGLVSTVLHGYLSLRRLVVQRTKLIDQTQEKLLELLDDMTTGTEEEMRSFIAVCVETIKKYPVEDLVTPVFIFERLCNLIYPEETDTSEFLLSLEKDPQQEDFLQGRMVGNPYSSNNLFMGPLMRDIKNKICRDCELIALLDDDNGMELLVHNKIISLDLPVKDVYNRIWLQDAHENEPMRIVYRMRGLLGDATEEFIENVASKESDSQDDEEVYGLANVMAECGGLEVMLERLKSIEEAQNSKQMISVLLKLFGHCIRVKVNREKLMDPKFGAIPILVNCLKMSLAANDSQTSELVLETMERLLADASKQASMSVYCKFASNCVEIADIRTFLDHAVNLKAGTALHQRLLRVLPFLTFGNDSKMAPILDHFADVLDFAKIDFEHGADDDAKMEAFVAMCHGIERNAIGNTMKSLMIETGVISKCLNYIVTNSPTIHNFVVVKSDDLIWMEFVSRPSLRFILRALAGLSEHHPQTQLAISEKCIPILHQIEQVSSDEHVGSLAEAVLEAIRGHAEVDLMVKAVRDHTKTVKKKLAMAMRAKQLKAIGLQANDQGQVKAENKLLLQFSGLAEESGLSCSICREGYKFQPTRVLAIYTYTRPCMLDEFEQVSTSVSAGALRKTMGYSTVTHFNLVHVDCHILAVRLQRIRDEWESAMLQNANTRCNGLLPLWGPQVSEAAFAACMAKHNIYLQEATRVRDITHQSTIHDLKLLISRFAQDKSFSNESGGGGPQSNMHLVPYLIHLALYVMNTTRAIPKEQSNLDSFLNQPSDKWLETCYTSDSPLYYTVLAIHIMPPEKWKTVRVKFLQRLLVMAHARAVSSQKITSLSDREMKEYEVYKLAILFFALVDQIFEQMFAGVPLNSVNTSAAEWATSLAEWIRHNDDVLLKLTSKVLVTFQEYLLPATSVDEMADVCGLLEEIPSQNPKKFLMDLLEMLP